MSEARRTDARLCHILSRSRRPRSMSAVAIPMTAGSREVQTDHLNASSQIPTDSLAAIQGVVVPLSLVGLREFD